MIIKYWSELMERSSSDMPPHRSYEYTGGSRFGRHYSQFSIVIAHSRDQQSSTKHGRNRTWELATVAKAQFTAPKLDVSWVPISLPS